MISRPRGVAHVSIMWFIVMIVLFLGALGFGYIQMQEVTKVRNLNTSLQSDLKKEKDKVTERDGKILDQSAPVGFNGGDANTPIQPDLVKTKVKELKEVCGAGESAKDLESVLPHLLSMISSQKRRISELEEQVGTATTAKEAAEEARANITREKDSRIDQLTQAKKDTEDNLRQQMATKDESIDNLRKSIREKNQEREDALTEWNKKRKELESEIAKLRIRNDRAKDKLRLVEDADKIDGRIISSSPKLAAAWINLGRKQMIKRGMQFEVLEERANTLVHKAWARVVTVRDEAAEVVISGLEDEYNPVSRGDVIKNTLYDPEVKFNFVLLGRFVEPLTKGDIKRILVDMGNTVSDKVTADTDYVIIGRPLIGEGVTPIEQSEEYGKAMNLSVNIVKLKKIRGFLQLY